MKTVEVLRKQAEANYEAQKRRRRERYRLARELGFSSPEAMVLAGRGKEYIVRLAQEMYESKAGEK